MTKQTTKDDFKMTKFTVWVGGVEVNDYYLTESEAYWLAMQYELQNYDDVCVEEVKDND